MKAEQTPKSFVADQCWDAAIEGQKLRKEIEDKSFELYPDIEPMVGNDYDRYSSVNKTKILQREAYFKGAAKLAQDVITLRMASTTCHGYAKLRNCERSV